MGKVLSILLIFLVPYSAWKIIDFFTPDFCDYVDFRLDQRYYFQRYNSFWYGIYKYPSRKLFKKVFQETPCNGSSELRETDSSGMHLSVDWHSNDVLIKWSNHKNEWPFGEEVITDLEALNEESYEVLVTKNEEICFRQKNEYCSVDAEAQTLRDSGIVIPKDYILKWNHLLKIQLRCLEKSRAYPKDKSEIPEQCKAANLI